MKKTLKKISALILAGAMVVAMAVPAFAAAEIGTDGTVGTNAGTALDKSITLEKELIVYNQDETTVAEPTITYTYTLSAGSSGKSITDEYEVQATTKAGILPEVTTATVVYSNADITASADGASNKKSFSFDFSGVSYNAAGVYRYVITETTSVEKAEAGITDGSISDIRYLDVYVRDAQGEETARQIYGYVLFSYDNSIDGTSDAADGTTVANAVKTTGFVSDTGSDGTTAITADQYYTFNVTVSKTLVGDSAMNSHEFPFSVDFTNAAVTQNVLLKQTTSGNITASAPAAAAVNSLDTAPSIANGGSVKYIGIPAGTTIAVYETNDVTGTTYKSEYSIDAASAAGTKNITWDSADDANKSNTATIMTTAGQVDAAAHTIAYTNTLELISPTGVVLRVAPYLAILAAGLALVLALAIRRRRTVED